jgi:Holliday junction resolvase RusA-like endonuclease
MTTRSFTIPGRLIGKGRPKFSAAPVVRAYEAALKNLRGRAADLAFRLLKEEADPSEIGLQIQTLPLLASGKDEQLGFVQVYTPSDTVEMEKEVAALGKAAMGNAPPLAGPVWLSIHAVLTPPPSWPKKRRATAYFVTGKPDLDNMLKLVGDALNEICWQDDSQIAAVSFARTYALDQEEAVKVTFGLLVDESGAIPFEKLPGIPEDMPLFAGTGA